MANRDWERLGEEIQRTVQEAVNSQNFDKLNQTVTDTINDAVDGIAKTLRNMGGAASKAGRAERGRGADGRRREFVYKEAEMLKEHGRNAADLYRGTKAAKAGGTLLETFGLGLGAASGFLFLFFLLGAFVSGGVGSVEFIILILSLAGSLVGFSMLGWGLGVKRRVIRFQSYIRILGKREYCNIRELAALTGKSVKYVTRDLEKLLLGGWFLQGHMDEERSCLIVSHDMYEQYLRLQAQRKSMEAEAAGMSVKEEGGREKSSRRLSPEIRHVIEEGEAYIQKIHTCNDAISGAEISVKISRMETVVNRIFDRVEHNPESVEDIRRMMDYYLPTTVKLLEAYRELDNQPVAGENIRSSKQEIERTLDTLNAAFEKLLDNLFQDTAWDVSSDISVLHTMLAQEGLTQDGLRG